MWEASKNCELAEVFFSKRSLLEKLDIHAAWVESPKQVINSFFLIMRGGRAENPGVYSENLPSFSLPRLLEVRVFFYWSPFEELISRTWKMPLAFLVTRFLKWARIKNKVWEKRMTKFSWALSGKAVTETARSCLIFFLTLFNRI